MIHETPGQVGHLLIIISFITSMVAAIGYFMATHKKEIRKGSWISFARCAFVIHGLSMLTVAGILFFLIANHYFEYHYVWSHSSLNLAKEYIIACFWEGQEGSFMTWAVWQALLGFVIIKTNKKWEAPVMTVFATVQAFLASMILGVVFGDLKIGSSPLLLRSNVIKDAIYLINPDYIPADGTGLNPLLQNYWMVIHPPVLFLGFATTLIPFSYAIAGLWTRKYKAWIRPALPWAIFSAMVLGVGILMGGYWAYETLNFEGFWNWDPVENAVYVPWLVLVAGIHTMITFKKSATALKTSIILVISTFILILYSTFLTRSGILGSASVHSFTDLGLSGQLLIYLLFFLAASVFFAARVWKEIPTSDKEASVYSREFWIFIGALTLCLMAFQVIVPTSIPVFNQIKELFGGISNIAVPANQVRYYSKFQVWFAISLALLSGTGQFFFWNKMDKKKLRDALSMPVMLSLVISAIIFLVAKIFNPVYIAVLLAGIYSITANAHILISLLKAKKYKLTGGAIAHTGIAMMLIGIMFAEGYSHPISLSTMTVRHVWSDEQNATNAVLFLNEPYRMEQYEVTYRQELVRAKGLDGLVKKAFLHDTNDPYYKVVKQEIVSNNMTLALPGDTLYLPNPENAYYQVEFKHVENGRKFTLYPRVQVNEQMGGILPSPDIKRLWNRDIYSHVTVLPVFNEEVEWSKVEMKEVSKGDRFFVNDYVATFNGLERVKAVNFAELGANDVAVKAHIEVMAENGQTYLAQPVFLIKGGRVAKQPDVIREVASRFSLEAINPDTGSVTLGVNTTQKDFIVLKAIVKPHINVLWIGTLVMVVGFLVATRRRYIEFKRMRDRGVE